MTTFDLFTRAQIGPMDLYAAMWLLAYLMIASSVISCVAFIAKLIRHWRYLKALPVQHDTINLQHESDPY